jgi:hypothetical protein
MKSDGAGGISLFSRLIEISAKRNKEHCGCPITSRWPPPDFQLKTGLLRLFECSAAWTAFTIVSAL